MSKTRASNRRAWLPRVRERMFREERKLPQRQKAAKFAAWINRRIITLETLVAHSMAHVARSRLFHPFANSSRRSKRFRQFYRVRKFDSLDGGLPVLRSSSSHAVRSPPDGHVDLRWHIIRFW